MPRLHGFAMQKVYGVGGVGRRGVHTARGHPFALACPIRSAGGRFVGATAGAAHPRGLGSGAPARSRQRRVGVCGRARGLSRRGLPECKRQPQPLQRARAVARDGRRHERAAVAAVVVGAAVGAIAMAPAATPMASVRR